MHTRPKIFMLYLDLKRINENCSSVAAYYICFEVISIKFQVHAQFTSAITKIVAQLQRSISVSGSCTLDLKYSCSAYILSAITNIVALFQSTISVSRL